MSREETRLYASAARQVAFVMAEEEERNVYIFFMDPGYRITFNEGDGKYVGWVDAKKRIFYWIGGFVD